MSSSLVLSAIGVLFGLSFVTLPSVSRMPAAPAEIRQQPQAKPAARQQGGVEEAQRVKQQVEAFLDRYIKTLESKDERAIRALFVDDDRFAWFTDGERAYSTPEEVLAGMRRYEGVRFQTSLSDFRVFPLAAGLASADSSFTTKLTIPGSSGVEFGGVITWLVEEDPTSGDWRVLLGHTSTPGGPPTESDGKGKR